MLYYVAEGYLVVADTISMRVQQCFEHKVTMTFNRNESRPGEDVGLLIQSAPHSHVSLTAVDKSVYLLDSNCGSQISADKVRYECTDQLHWSLGYHYMVFICLLSWFVGMLLHIFFFHLFLYFVIYFLQIFICLFVCLLPDFC